MGSEGELRSWWRVLAAAATGALVYMTNITAGCLPMKPKISTSLVTMGLLYLF